MKKNMTHMMIFSAIFALTVTGCGTAATQTNSLSTIVPTEALAETTAEESAAVHETITFDFPDSTKPADSAKSEKTESSGKGVSASYTPNGSSLMDTADLFSSRDLSQTPDLTDAKRLTASDGATLIISEAGVYVLSGTASDCTLIVETAEEDKVQIVLDGVNITNSDFPAIYIKSADKVFVTSAGSNTLSVTGTFRPDGDTNTDAVIYSKEDLVLNGTGTLKVTSASGNGITTKDDLKATGGTYQVQSALDAFEANDSIAISGGTFTIQTSKDGFHCENDSYEGSIYIADGSFTIQSGSDGIQATSILQIDGGTFQINSSEGLEATYVQINGGIINITASDDGINALDQCSSAYPVVIEFNGGETTIEMGQGDTDAVDANGSIYVNSGTINITAPTSSFDYDQNAEFNGGTIIINGQEVTEIPQSMMGGPGGFGGHGNFQPGQDGQQMPPGGRHGNRSSMNENNNTSGNLA